MNIVKMMKLFALLPLTTICALMAGCNGSSTSGTLSLGVADTPADSAKSVVVTFTGVRLQGASGPAKKFTFSPKQIDLMATQNGNAASLLNGVVVPAGNYQWVSLLMANGSQATITLTDDTVHTLSIPSGSQTGLKLVSGFTVAAGSQADFTIDFDLRKALTLANGTYTLKPAMRLINNQQVGTIAGSASNTSSIGTTSIASSTCGSPAVYIYSGTGVTPTDVNSTSTVQPITTATLSLNNSTGNYDYTAAFLAPGSYTLAVTCAADDTSTTTVDALAFSAAKDATVTANTTTSVDFL